MNYYFKFLALAAITFVIGFFAYETAVASVYTENNEFNHSELVISIYNGTGEDLEDIIKARLINTTTNETYDFNLTPLHYSFGRAIHIEVTDSDVYKLEFSDTDKYDIVDGQSMDKLTAFSVESDKMEIAVIIRDRELSDIEKRALQIKERTENLAPYLVVLLGLLIAAIIYWAYNHIKYGRDKYGYDEDAKAGIIYIFCILILLVPLACYVFLPYLSLN
jgi:hypothetical protein